MKFEFATATDVTTLAKELHPDYFNQYKKVYLTPDVWDCHVVRILEGVGEDYEDEEGAFLMEWNKIDLQRKGEDVNLGVAKRILTEDSEDGGNWDYTVYYSMEEVIEAVDGGFGIN